jgi:hypothetical protein
VVDAYTNPHEDKDFHWLVSSGIGWAANEDLRSAMNEAERLSDEIAGLSNTRWFGFWRVPGPCKGTEYKIRWPGQPQIEGAELIDVYKKPTS